jgi:hypothetical protein
VLQLQGREQVAWFGKNMVRRDQVIQLDPENGRPTAICMAANGLPGKLVDVYFHEGEGLSGVCYTSWGGRNYAHNDLRVLVRI